MLTIGEFSNDQLEKMLLINRLKAYRFSLEEIKAVFESEELMDEVLFAALNKKKREIAVKVRELEDTLHQIDGDLSNLRKGESVMSYMESIEVQLVEIPRMYLLSIRKNVLEHEFSEEYGTCFGKLFRKMEEKKLTAAAPPMVLFHGDEYTPFGLDTEFAIPIKECVTGTRDFCPGLCLKTVVKGSYRQLPSVYAKQMEWAEREGYENSNALYEVYVTDPGETSKESELVTEVYYPVKKRGVQRPEWQEDLVKCVRGRKYGSDKKERAGAENKQSVWKYHGYCHNKKWNGVL